VASCEDLVGSSGDLLARRGDIDRIEIVDISTKRGFLGFIEFPTVWFTL
jgi:hypothetical protein